MSIKCIQAVTVQGNEAYILFIAVKLPVIKPGQKCHGLMGELIPTYQFVTMTTGVSDFAIAGSAFVRF